MEMKECFGVREVDFRPDEVIYDFDRPQHMIGVLLSGTAVVDRIDEQGNRTVLEHLSSGGVFGEMLMFRNVTGDSINVICEQPCRVWFVPEASVTKRCENACAHHSRVVENLFHLVAEKATALSERVEVLSRRSIREKLLCFFSMQSAHCGSAEFTLPFSLSTLADYISTDRSAMMRELRRMREDRLLSVSGRHVVLPFSPAKGGNEGTM
jgi:CRP-like cAMP-binding protein